jgi:hypothetical protein
MSLIKKIAVDRIEVLDNGCIQVRVRTSIFEDDKEIGVSLHRYVVAPGDDYSKEDERVQSICAVTHTSEVIATYKAALAAQGV